VEFSAEMVHIMRLSLKMSPWVLIVSALLIGGCTSQPEPEPASTSSTPPPVSATSSTAPTTTTTTAPDPYTYQSDPQRVARISAALQGFGATVLEQDRTRGPWGPFDIYCATQGSTEGGWRSEGRGPTPGDICAVQHNPSYGGPNIRIAVDVVIGPNGAYTDQFVNATIDTPACATSVHYYAPSESMDVTIGEPPNMQTSYRAATVAEVDAIDNQAIACLNTTRP